MHRRWRQERDAGVVMGVVIPLEQRPRPGPRIRHTAKALRRGRMVLHRLELRFRERIVIRHLRPAMRLGDPQIGQQVRHAFRRHGAAPVRMQRQLLRGDPFLGAGLGDERFGQRPVSRSAIIQPTT